MSNNTHTPEPWELAEPSEYPWKLLDEPSMQNTATILGKGGFGILCTPETNVGRRSDLERIVSCVNACAGLADPAEALRLAREALELFTRLEIPRKPIGNAGMYSLPFEHIQKAKQALSALTPNKPE